jgi:hypothetical protein
VEFLFFLRAVSASMTAGVALMPTPATLFDITISRDITKAFLSPYLSSVYHHGSALSISIKHFDEISNKIELKKTNKQEKYIDCEDIL